MSLAPIEQHHFRRVCSKYATGITIVTVLDSRGEPHGLTVNSFTSVSLSPPLVLFCLDRQTAILNHFRLETRFAINVLEEEQKDISSCFARSGYDRFEGVAWRPGETGAPVRNFWGQHSVTPAACRASQKSNGCWPPCFWPGLVQDLRNATGAS